MERLLLLALLLSPFVISPLAIAADPRPNLVVFLADDLGYGDIGCFGSERVKTPRIDQLAAEGARFTSFYGPSSVCSPTRTGMLTGRSPFRLGIYTYIPTGSAMHLQRSERTLANLLRDAGYDTCFVGKWAANGSFTDRSQPQPNDFGFDHWFAAQNNATPSHLNPDCFVRNGVPVPKTQGYSAALIVDEATEWLSKRQDKSKPFCLFVWFQEPHRVIATPAEFMAPYAKFGVDPILETGNRAASQERAPSLAAYLGNIAHMDYQVGRVLDALKASSEDRNTFTLFTSDNGPIAPGSAGPLRAGKGTVWEGGIRMPGVIHWPGQVKPGRVVETPVGGLDLLPTFCAIAGIPAPSDRALDGENILPLLQGREFTRNRPQYWWRINGEVALREGDWKIKAGVAPDQGYASRVDWYQNAAVDRATAELYNLKDDLGEQRNLAAQHPEILARLTPKLAATHAAMQEEQRRTVAWRDEALPVGNQRAAATKKGKAMSARPTQTIAAPAATTAVLLAPVIPAKKPNILFIAVDDLRPQLGCYGVEWMKTPHMDSLAARGVRFDRHYVQFAVCIPSRVALLTSLRSERTQQVYGPHVWQEVAQASSLARTFNRAGYATVSLGKIWHGKTPGEKGDLWDEEWHPQAPEYHAAAKPNDPAQSRAETRPVRKAQKKNAEEEDGRSFFEMLDVPDETYRDGELAVVAVDRLKRLAANKDKPFLLAVGFQKPHLPFVAPQKYWDLYDRAALPLPPHPGFPQDSPEIARNHGLNKGWADIATGPKAEYDEATVRHLVHGYSAATSYADAQIGKVLATLRELGLEKDTIVVLWGDHGWHLGDLHQWAKSTNYERAARSPLIVCAPGKQTGVSSAALVETVDIFPTLADLCGLPALPLTDGKSFAPLLTAPEQPWKEAAYHVFNRPGGPGGKANPIIGYAVRTASARYVEWHRGWSLDGELVAREFYLYSPSQPDELANLAEKPEAAEAVSAHAKLLRRNSAFIKP